EPLEVEPPLCGELEKDRPELLLEARRAVHQALQRLLGLLQLPHVGEVAAALHGEEKAVGRLAAPGLEDGALRQAIEGEIDLYGPEILGVEWQLPLARQLVRVEGAQPVLVDPAGGADPEFSHSSRAPSSIR